MISNAATIFVSKRDLVFYTVAIDSGSTIIQIWDITWIWTVPVAMVFWWVMDWPYRSNQIDINFLNIIISPCDDFTLYSLIFAQIIYLKCDYTIHKLSSFVADSCLLIGFVLR